MRSKIRSLTLAWLLAAAGGCGNRVLYYGDGGTGGSGSGGSPGSAGADGSAGAVSMLVAGLDYTCALSPTGIVTCWGANNFGQLGNGSTAPSPPGSRIPTPVLGLTGATGVAAGFTHTCAVLSDGTARCWGTNDKGQLGDGTVNPSSQPVVVAGLNNVVQISAGAQHTCAMLGDGGARCWGYNLQGQLGNGSTTNSSVPIQVSSQGGFAALAAGDIHTCAIVDDPGHDVVCWGDNMYGQLGPGQVGARGSPKPIPLVGLSNVRSLAAGDVHTCAVLFDGSARCWGDSLAPSAPFTLILPLGVVSLSSRYHNGCVTMSDGSAACWGANEMGQLGNGSKTDSTSPVVVTGLLDVATIATGESHACASTKDGSVYCWGSNTYGQLGNTTAAVSLTPSRVLGLP